MYLLHLTFEKRGQNMHLFKVSTHTTIICPYTIWMFASSHEYYLGVGGGGMYVTHVQIIWPWKSNIYTIPLGYQSYNLRSSLVYCKYLRAEEDKSVDHAQILVSQGWKPYPAIRLMSATMQTNRSGNPSCTLLSTFLVLRKPCTQFNKQKNIHQA